MQNTIYIAEPLFSEHLQRFDNEASFPPIKKIGITTDSPARRERELLGTVSPVKVAIIKAWTGVDARKVETMLHTILDNSRLDGEYFWDGNLTLVEAVTNFIQAYHPEASEIKVFDAADVVAATQAVDKKSAQRIYTEVVPELDRLNIQYRVTKNGNAVRFKFGEYLLTLGGRNSGKYTLTIYSKTKTSDQALEDFPGAIELSENAAGESDRKARISLSPLSEIINSLEQHKGIKNT